MSLEAGQKLAHYEILEPIGKGGMGEVYRARDIRLGRSVAIKLLPERFRGDANLRARLEHEARAISKLSHPNICALYDVGHEGDIDFLVMELLNGETLLDRLRRGPLSADETLKVAAAIARALDRAHKGGIVHRDLKPGNVVLTPDGPKVLDFGLAKDIVPKGGVSLDSESPTALLTGEGMIVGTLHYMAPEQLAGKSVDARTDVFAFGCVVHEMLSNRRAFDGDNQASVIAAILEREPEPLEGVPGLSSSLKEVLARCLAKDPERRWQSLGDVATLLESIPRWSGGGPSPAGLEDPSVSRRSPGSWLALAFIGLVAAAVGLVVGRIMTSVPEPKESPPIRVVLERALPGGLENISNPSVSHDGRMVAFIGSTGETSGLYLRRLDELEPRHLENTESAGWVTFSHDDQWLAYFDTTNRRILKISIHGGPPEVLAEPGYLPFDWRADGSLYYPARQSNRALETPEGLGIWRLGPGDDAPEPITRAEMGALGRLEVHSSPTLLPGGRHLLVSRGDGFLQTGWKTGVLDLDTGEWHILSESANQTQYAGSYWILWRNHQLWAAPLDDDFELSKPPRPVLDGVGQHPRAPLEIGEFHVGDDGSLVYIREGTTTSESTRLLLAKDDGSGESEELLRISDQRTMDLILSPEGRRVAARRCSARSNPNTLGGEDVCSIWLYTFAEGQWSQLSPPGGSYGYPIWDPSGDALVFSSLPRPAERPRLVRQRLGSGALESLMEGDPDDVLILVAVTPMGDVLLNALDRNAGHIHVLLVREDGEVDVLREARRGELATDLSRDGRWLLLGGGDTAVQQVHLLDLEASESEPRQLTTDGGWYPAFSADEKSIYYRAASYPGRSQILRAALDLDSGRLGSPSVVAETASVNTADWRRLGYLSAVPQGVVFTVSQASSTGGELILARTGSTRYRRSSRKTDRAIST